MYFVVRATVTRSVETHDVQEHDGLIERWKRKNMENLLELHNKTPVWNEGEEVFWHFLLCYLALIIY